MHQYIMNNFIGNLTTICYCIIINLPERNKQGESQWIIMFYIIKHGPSAGGEGNVNFV